MELKYTDEKAILLLIAALKQYGIRHVVVSPGSTNALFAGSLQHDDFFQLYSCVDERSAAYMACGIAEETGEPIVITCTGATASRNYLPGLTEAYYRKLPVLAVCGHRGVRQIGHLFDQVMDRRKEPVDCAKEQVWLPYVKDEEDEQYCRNEITKAMLALKPSSLSHEGGPVIITLCTHYSSNMSVHELPEFRKVELYSVVDELPIIPEGRVAIALGSHHKFTEKETKAIDNFCATYDAVVFCDYTSGYYGKYAVHAPLLFGQQQPSELASVDILISAGEISGDARGVGSLWSAQTWRVNEDGAFRNKDGKVTKIFEMSLPIFCEHYAKENMSKDQYLCQCKEAYVDICSKLPELPLSNVWIAKMLIPNIPQGSSVFLGIYNSLRSYNLFEWPEGVEGMANVGGFGTDGTLSSVVGRSIASPHRLCYCVLGDLAFFYDMNVLGNRHIAKNLRILLINNGLGDEFRMWDSPAHNALGEDVRPYVAAEGHYGGIQNSPVKGYVESMGYKYLCASSKEEVMACIPEFTSTAMNQSIVFEVVVKPEDDTESMDILRNVLPVAAEKVSLKKKIKRSIKNVIGGEKIEAIKTLLK